MTHDLDNNINEAGRHIVSKRKYREYPAETISTEAPVRNRILSFVAEKKIVTKSQLREYMETLSEDLGKQPASNWISRNSHYFRIGENSEGETTYKLSRRGERVLNSIIKYESYKDSVRKEIEQEMLAKQNKRIIDDKVDMDSVLSRKKYKVNEEYFDLIYDIEERKMNEAKSMSNEIQNYSKKRNYLLEFISKHQPVSLKEIKRHLKNLNESENINIDLKFLRNNKNLFDRKINRNGTSSYSLTEKGKNILKNSKV